MCSSKNDATVASRVGVVLSEDLFFFTNMLTNESNRYDASYQVILEQGDVIALSGRPEEAVISNLNSSDQD